MRKGFPMPNIDTTLQQMNGIKHVFTVGPRRGVSSNCSVKAVCRYFTTFVCHKCLFRYKCLNRNFFYVGIIPANFATLMQDIPNCKNMVDDIIICADNQEDQDKVLKRVLTI